MSVRKVFGYFKTVPKKDSSQGVLTSDAEHLKVFCRQQKLTPVQLFDDPFSDKKTYLGEQFCHMLKELVLQNISIIVVNSLRDLANTTSLQFDIIYYLASKKIDIYSMEDGSNVTKNWIENPRGKSQVQLRSELTLLDRSLHMTKLVLYRKRTRERLGKCEGRKSYQEIAPDTIREIRKLRRRRVGQKKRTFQEVARILNQTGYVTSSGKEFTSNNVSVILHRNVGI